MATTPYSLLPGQQVPAGAIPETLASASASSTAGHYASGSIGPFFGVMSMLIVVLVASCVVGRVCVDSRADQIRGPLQRVKYGDGWVRWLRWRCVEAGDLEVGGGKVVAEDEKPALCSTS